MEYADLRPIQQQAVSMLREKWKLYDTHLINASCGFGKTAVASYLAQAFSKANQKTLFVAPYVTLVNQTHARFTQYGHTDLGVIWQKDERTDPHAMVQIASADTLIRRAFPSDISVLIVDECDLKRKVLLDIIKNTPGLKTIGLTATPFAKWLGEYYQNFIKPATTQQLIADGLLVPFDISAPFRPDLTGVKVKKGYDGEFDYDEDAISNIMGDAKIAGNILDNWLKYGENEPTIGFAPNVSTANAYTVQFRQAGIPAEVVTAETPIHERDQIFSRFSDGVIKVIWNVGVLGAGFDSDVRCIIWARPTKSERAWVQGVMRGSRPAVGKSTCVAKGTKILTNKGLVKIEDVTFDHKVWDGVKFVSHGGSYCKGIKETIIYDGLCATPDHKVMTKYGWENFEEVAGRLGKVINSGRGWKAIRVFENNFAENRKFHIQSFSRSCLSRLRRPINGAIPQHAKKAKQKRMSYLQGKNSGYSPALAVCKVQRSAAKVPESFKPIIRAIWRKRDRIQIQKREFSFEMGDGTFGVAGKYKRNGVGQNKQQWALRSRESKMVNAIPKHAESKKFQRSAKKILFVSLKLPRNSLCGRNIENLNSKRINRSSNSREISFAFSKTKREVWDIHDCGDLQRFTANDKLVHNCTLFDHSGSYYRLGCPTEIEYFELHDGSDGMEEARKAKREKREKATEGKTCTQCQRIKEPGEYVCRRCGYKPLAGEITVEVDEDIQLKSVKGKVKKFTQEEKNQFHAELLGYKRERANAGKIYSDGWVANQFRKKFGVWPKGMGKKESPPSPTTLGFIKSGQIAWAKRKDIA